jgi:hypothetical protein
VAIALGVMVSEDHPPLSYVLIGGGILATVLLICLAALLVQCLEQIIAATLSVFARTGKLPDEVSPDLLPAKAA